MPPASLGFAGGFLNCLLRPFGVLFAARSYMKKNNQSKLLKLILLILILALIAVGGYIFWQEYQYSVSEDYYDSLRNTGLMGGRWML